MSDRQCPPGQRAELPSWKFFVVYGVVALLVFGVAVGLAAGYLDEYVSLLLSSIFLISGLGSIFYLGPRFYGRYTLVGSTPVKPVQSVTMGQTALEGVARPAEQVFPQPFGEGECLYANWKVEDQTGTGESESWSQVASGTLSAPFYLEDDTGREFVDEIGKVLVDDPEDATVRISEENVDSLGAGEVPEAQLQTFYEEHDVPTSRHRRRVEQKIITPDTDLYVLGVAERLDDPEEWGANDVVITDGDGDDEFIVADSDQREVERNYRNLTIAAVFYGLVCIPVSLYFVVSELQSLGLL